MKGVVKYVGLVGLAIVLAVMASRLTSLGGGDNASRSSASSSGTAGSSASSPTASSRSQAPTPNASQSAVPEMRTGAGAVYAMAVKHAYRLAIGSAQPKPLWRVYVNRFASVDPGTLSLHTTLGSHARINRQFAGYMCDFVADLSRSGDFSPELRSVAVKALDGITLARCGRANPT